jgi:hypothetical protein
MMELGFSPGLGHIQTRNIHGAKGRHNLINFVFQIL